MNEIEPISSGQRKRSSDMLSALENLEQTFHAYRFCMNRYAANAVLMGLAIEAQTLALKMKAMLARWNKYLPFHEVLDVKFDHWQERVGEWIDVLELTCTEETYARYPWLEGCHEYMLDLYALTERTDAEGQQVMRAPEFYEVGIENDYQREMTAYKKRTDGLLKEMGDLLEENKWREEIDSMAVDSLRDAYQADAMSRPTDCTKEPFGHWLWLDETLVCALTSLRFLHRELCGLHALFCKHLPNEMFIRLSNRLFYRHCQGSYRAGETQVNKWHNGWPEAKLKDNALKKKEELKKQLMGMPYGQELQEYISLDAPDLFGDSNFGKFLFTNRHELKREDVQYIHKICRELNLLNQLIGLEGEKVPTASASTRQLDKREQKILDQVLALARKATWKSISAEFAVQALQQALGSENPLTDPKQAEMSQTLWALLKKRRGCDEEKSLQVTWLNLVGYWVKKGFLSGGSPALAKQFFPNCGSDDYKAIDKGRTAENKNFLSIIPLLDACFDAKR